MIGKNILEINIQDLVLRGMSTSANMTDGAFSPETDAVNLSVQGTLHHVASPVDSDTDNRLTGNIIATSPDMNVTSPTNRLIIADTGTAYRYNGTKITAAAVALTAARTWTKGFTDIIVFGGEAYVTSKESITRWDNADTIDGGADYPFAFTNATVPHPALVYENNAYYGDGNVLKIQSTVGVAPTTILTLSADQVIMALGIDPGSGHILISTTTALDVSDTLPKVNKLLWYDGNSLKVSKSAIVEDMITAFHCVGGVVLVGYGQSIGYVNGAGIAFLRKLQNVSLSNIELPYKHNFASINKMLYVLDGLQVLAFGEIIPGRKIWHYCYRNNINANKPTAIFAGGGSKLGVAFAATGPTYEFYTIDTTSVADSNTITFYTNKYRFPRPVFIRSGYIEYSDAVVNNDNNRFLYYKTEDESLGFNLLEIQGNVAGTGLKNITGASVYSQDDIIGFLDSKMRSIQFRYNASAANSGVKRIVFTYDVSE